MSNIMSGCVARSGRTGGCQTCADRLIKLRAALADVRAGKSPMVRARLSGFDARAPARDASGMKALVVSSLAADFAGCALADVPDPVRRRRPGADPRPRGVAQLSRSADDRGQVSAQARPAVRRPVWRSRARSSRRMPTAASRWASRWSLGRDWAGSPNWLRSMRPSVRAKPTNLTSRTPRASARRTTPRMSRWSGWRMCSRASGSLVHGATGGVGLAAVDLAKTLGCRVIATSRSAEKLAVVAREYAPDATLPAPGFREAVKELTGGGADVIYDPVGGDVFDELARAASASAGGCWWSASRRAGSRASRPTFR